MSGAAMIRVTARRDFPLCGHGAALIAGAGAVQLCVRNPFSGALIWNRFCDAGTAGELRAIADALDGLHWEAGE